MGYLNKRSSFCFVFVLILRSILQKYIFLLKFLENPQFLALKTRKLLNWQYFVTGRELYITTVPCNRRSDRSCDPREPITERSVKLRTDLTPGLARWLVRGDFDAKTEPIEYLIGCCSRDAQQVDPSFWTALPYSKALLKKRTELNKTKSRSRLAHPQQTI